MSPLRPTDDVVRMSPKNLLFRKILANPGLSFGEALASLFRPEKGIPIFIGAIFVFYGVIPFLIGTLLHDGNRHFIELSQMAAVATASLYVGYLTCDLLKIRPLVFRKLAVAPRRLTLVVIVLFIMLQIALIVTAPAVPILSAIAGAPSDQLAIEREEFLKSRSGGEKSLVYANAVFAGSLVPYIVALSLFTKMKNRWGIFFGFLFSCTIFLEKAFFLKAVLPVMSVFSQGGKRLRRLTGLVCISSILVLLLITLLSGSGRVDVSAGEQDISDYVSASYVPQGPVDHLVWRTLAVPIFTAVDSLEVIESRYEGTYMLGATSSFVVAVFDLEKIELERSVFAFQWGQNPTGTGSANSVFFIEAFANFGYWGVVLFSYAIGIILWWMRSHENPAIGALWTVFALGLFVSGFLGMMLSNGFIITFILVSLTKWERSQITSGAPLAKSGDQ